MWTFRVAVAIGGRGVDANLGILQVIGSPESRFFTWFSFSLAPASRSCVSRAFISRQTVRARRTFHDRRPVQSRAVAVQEISRMADRRDWGGGGDDPEESTQRMIERIWESLTDIRTRMDQQALVPPVAVPPGDGETVPIAPVPPRVEVPFVAPVPPPVLLAEEPVMQVQKGAWRTVGRVALPNCARKRRGVVQFPSELAEGSV
ncbi:hypothetical protein Taro_041847 [Colocasia esculenta]|uniref:Uncharacterized protein n=1 Tax=Colocasia esculenta TaxID=4460 RepID=A0A843WMV3_COLES|nr:hypothetical protein [Colocasia esculenta]